MQEEKKAENFYQIQDAVAFNVPVSSDSPFYTDLTPYRKDFTEKKIFKHLNINPNNKNCSPLGKHKKIFLTGYRGTGKTSELLKLQSEIDKTHCYFTIFVDIANGDLDTNNIETVDIFILMIHELLNELQNREANIKNETITDFFDFYKSTIVEESNKKLEGSAQIESSVELKAGLLGFIKLISNTKAKLKGSQESKTTIRREINNNFSLFSDRLNEFLTSLTTQLRSVENRYEDILFIVDGFEKIGSLEDRKKILIDDSNKLTIINTHMIITLPIELFTQQSRLSNFAVSENFPLIDLNKEGAKERFKEFITKRVDEKLFEDGAIDKIIEYGAGHPRQTLHIINRAYIESEEELITIDSVIKAIEILGNELSKIDEKEIRILHSIYNKKIIPQDDTYITLKERNIIFEYGSSTKDSFINPVVKENEDIKKLLNSIDDVR